MRVISPTNLSEGRKEDLEDLRADQWRIERWFVWTIRIPSDDLFKILLFRSRNMDREIIFPWTGFLPILISTYKATYDMTSWFDTMDNALLYMAGVLVVSGGWPWPDHAVLYAFYGVGSVINLQHGWHENRKFTEKQLIYYYYETQGRTKLRTNAITLRNVMLSAALSWSFPLFWSEWQQRRSKPRVLSEPVWKPVGCKLSPRFGKF